MDIDEKGQTIATRKWCDRTSDIHMQQTRDWTRGDIFPGVGVIFKKKKKEKKKTSTFGYPSHRPSHPQYRGIDGSNRSHDHARLQDSKEIVVNIYKLF